MRVVLYPADHHEGCGCGFCCPECGSAFVVRVLASDCAKKGCPMRQPITVGNPSPRR